MNYELKSGEDVIKELSVKYGVAYETVESIIAEWIRIEYLSLTERDLDKNELPDF